MNVPDTGAARDSEQKEGISLKKLVIMLASILVLASVVGFAGPVGASAPAPAPDPSITVSIDHTATSIDIDTGNVTGRTMWWSVGWDDAGAWAYNVNIETVTTGVLVTDFNVDLGNYTSPYSQEYVTDLTAYSAGTYRLTITLLNKKLQVPTRPRFNFAEATTE